MKILNARILIVLLIGLFCLGCAKTRTNMVKKPDTSSLKIDCQLTTNNRALSSKTNSSEYTKIKEAEYLPLSLEKRRFNSQTVDIFYYTKNNFYKLDMSEISSESVTFYNLINGVFLLETYPTTDIWPHILSAQRMQDNHFRVVDYGFSWIGKPTQLKNGKIVVRGQDMQSIHSISLIDPITNDTLELNFDYGITVNNGYLDKVSFHQRFVDTIIYDMESRKYIMSYIEFSNLGYKQKGSGSDIGTIGIAVLDEQGNMLKSFLLDNITMVLYSKGSIKNWFHDICVLESGKIQLSLDRKGQQAVLVDINAETYQYVTNHTFPTKDIDLSNICPLKVFFDADKAKIYNKKTGNLISEIWGYNQLCFYAVEDNEFQDNCYLLLKKSATE